MECILNQVSSLSDLEKLVLYLKLPTGIARQHTNPSSGNNGTSTESGKIEVQVANRWIKTRLQVDKDVCLPKQDVYDAYREYCDKESHKWVNQADFGKLIKGIYPDVRTRRLGNRGQSKHCYGGLSMHFVELPVPETLSIEIPSPTSTPPKVPGSSVNGEVLPAACVVVCEWASKVLEQKVGDIIQLAQYLVTHNLVTMCSTAALTISASVPKKTSLSTDAGSAPSTPTTPVPGKQREAQIQLQRKLHEKEQLKKQKEKQRNITAESSATSIQQQQQQQGTGTSSSSVAVLSSGGQQTPVTSAPVAPEAVAPSSSAAVQRLMFVSPSAGSASTNTSMGNPVVSAPSGVPATNVLMFSPQSQDKPVQHKPKNKYSSKTVSFLLKEQRGFNSQDKDDKLAYVNDTRPVSQLLKESRERKQKTMTSALKVSTTNAPQPILIKPMSPNSQGKLPSNGKPQQTEENSLLENQQQTSASELLQTFSQLKQQQQQNSELNQLPQQFTSLQEQQPPVQQQQQPQLQQQQQLQVQQQQVQQPQQPQVQQQFQVQQQQQQPQQPLLQQVQQQSLVQQQQQQQSLVQQQQSLAQQQSMLQQQQDQQQLQQQLQLLDQQQQQQQGQGHMMQQQMQQMQQQPQMQQLQQLCDQQLMQPRQSVDFNPQFDASYSNVGAGNNGFEQFVASPGSGSGSLASATSTPMLSPACLSPMLSNTEPSNSFTPIQQHSTLQQMHRTHGSMEQNTADFMNYGQTNNNNNLNLMMKNNTDMMFQRGMDFNTQYNMQQPAKRTMTQMADASKRRRHCSAPNKPVSGMFANPNTLPILKQFPAAMAGAQEQQQEQQQQQQQPMNMMDSSASYGSTEQWATQPSPEVATILQQPVQGEQAMPPPAPGEQEAALSRSRSVPVPVIDDLADLFNEPGSVFLTPTVPAPCKNMTNQYTQPLQDNSNNPFNNLLLPQTTDEKSPYISGHRGDHMISGASVNDSIATRMKRLAACKYDK